MLYKLNTQIDYLVIDIDEIGTSPGSTSYGIMYTTSIYWMGTCRISISDWYKYT